MENISRSELDSFAKDNEMNSGMVWLQYRDGGFENLLKVLEPESQAKIFRLLQSKINRVPVLKEIDFIDKMNSLQHFKDTTTGLWATDEEPKDKTKFFKIE